VNVDNLNNRFSPGMTGELAFIMAEKPSAIVVPSQAIQNNAVYVVRDSTMKRIAVEVGLKSIERTEIVSGISPGDRVIVSNVAALPDDQRVRTSYVDPVTAAGLNKKATQTDSFKGFNR
jgi:hypothetical protein